MAPSLTTQLQQRGFAALNRVVVPLVRAGVGSPLPGAGVGLVLVETTGHKSRKRRTVPLVGVRVGDKVFTSTVRPTSHWVTNVETDGDTAVWLNGHRRPTAGTVSRGPLTVASFTLSGKPPAPT